MNLAGLRCYRCQTLQQPGYAGYLCPACGGNVEVIYDYEAIGTQLGGAFPSARMDIFRYWPLLPLTHQENVPTLRVGQTPLYHAPALAAAAGLHDVLIKDEGLNPSASFKDRASAVALARARDLGAPLTAGASTGNAGSSMACMSANLAMPCVIFVPEQAPAAKITQLLIFGARVLAVRGSYDDAFNLCADICERRGWFNRNTGYNPYTREGKKTCSFEIWEQTRGNLPDWIVVPTGDGNIISGIWKGLRELREIGFAQRLPRLLCAQSERSDAVTRTVQALRDRRTGVDWTTIEVATVQATTLADSISVNAPRDGLAAVRAVIESDGQAVTVPDAAILEACSEVARLSGVFVEPAAAASWACLKRAVNEGIVGAGERVLCLFTGSGLKDIANARKAVGNPVCVDPDPHAVEELLDRMPRI